MQLWINKREQKGQKYLTYPEAFIEYINDMILMNYTNIDKHSPPEKNKSL